MKDKIEQWFSQLSRALSRNPRKTLIIVFTFVAILCSQIPKIVIDVSPEALLHRNDPARLVYDEFRAQFGRPELIVVAVESTNIFSEAFLLQLKSLHHDLEEGVPYRRRVTSLINARDTYGDEDTLVVGELLEDWPDASLDLEALKQKVLANPFYENSLISEGGQITTLIVETEAVVEPNLSEEDSLDQFQDDGINNEDTSLSGEATGTYFSEKENAAAVSETMLGTGRALLMTSIILSSGFFILLVSSLSLLKVFGVLTGITIILALLADFLLVPALLRLTVKDR